METVTLRMGYAVIDVIVSTITGQLSDGLILYEVNLRLNTKPDQTVERWIIC